MQKYLNTPEYFEKLANDIEFIDSVPDDIKKYYNRIRSLIRFSYYEYEFVDVAAQLALISFEMALKLRYKEIEERDSTLSFFKLIEWSINKKLITIEKKRLIALKDLRNHSVHIDHFSGSL
ncbi:MAG: hypothetical protein J0L62_15780 [Bacteroidetes bacterium]|nr:hypothetical protein [Bacteroidota bacterium]